MRVHTIVTAGLVVSALALGACNVFKATSQTGAQTAAAGDLAGACAKYSAARGALGLAVALPSPFNQAATIVEMFVDPVCANQVQFAKDAGTVAWVIKNAASLAGLKLQAAGA